MNNDGSMTRRTFLRATAGTALTGGWVVTLGADDPTQDAWTLGRKSVVARSRAESVCAGRDGIRSNILGDLFTSCLQVLSRTDSQAQAWRKYLAPDDVIGIKCNPYGADELDTLEPLVRQVVSSLVECGWSSRQIVLSDAPAALVRELDTRPFRREWRKAVDFGSGKDRLSSFVQEVTAVINLPLLKTDNITGISGCLKNITYFMLKHPARLHQNGGAPYLADVYALPEIRGKLKLNIMNGLRTVFDNGPLVTLGNVDNSGLLVMGTDPVAVDVVSAEELNRVRQARGLQPIPITADSLPALFDAAEKGLGYVDFRKIERLKARYD